MHFVHENGSLSHFVTDTVSVQYITCVIKDMNHKIQVDLTVNFILNSLNLIRN